MIGFQIPFVSMYFQPCWSWPDGFISWLILVYYHFFFLTLWMKPTWKEITKYSIIRVRTNELTFLFLIQNICCGYSKEPSQWDGSFEHPKHILKLMDKKIFTILRSKILFIMKQTITTNLSGFFSAVFGAEVWPHSPRQKVCFFPLFWKKIPLKMKYSKKKNRQNVTTACRKCV